MSTTTQKKLDHQTALRLKGGAVGDRYHVTEAQHDTLTDGTNADGLHIHSAGAVGADPAGTADAAVGAHELTVDHPVATDTVKGMMSDTDKAKLDVIPEDAEANNISDVDAATLTGGSNSDDLHIHSAAAVGADPAGSASAVQGNLDSHEGDETNPHVVTAAQAGADPVGAAESAVDAHELTVDHPESTDSTKGMMSASDTAKLAAIEALAEVNNISDADATDLTDGTDSTLHYHDSDRDRANHTGTQTAATISDFDVEVANNTDVSANTSARHTEDHAGRHVDGTDDIQDATASQKGLATATQITKLDGIEPDTYVRYGEGTMEPYTFSSTDLTARKITIQHNLNTLLPFVYVYTDGGKVTGPIESEAVDLDNVTLDCEGLPTTFSDYIAVITGGMYTMPDVIPLSLKGAANGVAELGSDGLLPDDQCPDIAVKIMGDWDADTNTPTLSDAAGNNGELYVVSVGGSQDLGSGAVTYTVGETILYNGTAFQKNTVVLGETSTTAHRGDRGKIAYDHSQVAGVMNVLYVGKNGNDSTGTGDFRYPFLTVKEAFANVTTPSATNRYTIFVGPGVYDEVNPIQTTEYTALKAMGDLQTTRLVATVADDLLLMANFFTVEGLAFWGVSGTGKYALNQSVASSTSVTRCVFGECVNGALVNHSGAKMVLNDVGCLNVAVSMVRGAYCTAGELDAYAFAATSGTVGTLVEHTGTDSAGSLSNVNSSLSTLTTGIVVDDLASVDITGARLANLVAYGIDCKGGSRVFVTDAIIRGTVGTRILRGINVEGTDTHCDITTALIEHADFGIHCDDSSRTHAAAFSLNLCDTGIYMNSTGSPILGVAGGSVLDSMTLDVDLQNSNATLIFTGIMNEDKLFLDDANVVMNHLARNEGDEGTAIKGELHVGSPEKGTESVFGEGDSYTRGMLVYTWDGTDYVDISANAASPSASTFTFPNASPLVGDAIYVSSDITVNALADYHKFYGIKMLSSVAQVGGTIVAEYWNGSAWTEFNHMTAQAGGKYYRKADTLFLNDAGSYQVRFDPAIADDWAVSDYPSVDANDRYWMRFRITSAPSTLPVFEQFKLHSNRHEINSDGFEEDMGTARPIIGISVPWSAFQDAASKMGKDDLYRSDNTGVGMDKNHFEDVNDNIGTILTLPPWVDTSSPLKLVVALASAGTGTCTMTATLNSSKDGDTVKIAAAPGNTTDEVTSTVSKTVTGTATDGVQVTYTFLLDISSMGLQEDGGTPETVWVNLNADAIPAGGVYGMTFNVGFLSWRRGSHI